MSHLIIDYWNDMSTKLDNNQLLNGFNMAIDIEEMRWGIEKWHKKLQLQNREK